MISKIAAAVTIMVALVGGIFAVENRYALADDVTISLSEKADAEDVRAMQEIFLEDKLQELKLEEFIIHQTPQAERSTIEKFKLQQIELRLERVNRKLNEE